MERRTKVLIIAYHFPPEGGVKVKRILKFVKYLPEFGIDPIVVTPRNHKLHFPEDALLAEIPSCVDIHRVPFFDIFKILYKARDLLRRARKSSHSNSNITSLSEINPHSWAKRIVNLTMFPDHANFWVRKAVRQCLKIIKEDKPSLIFSTSPPFSVHFIGNRLQRITGLPHVVDMRDLWLDNPYTQMPTDIHRRYATTLESRTFTEATSIITVTERMKQDILNRYPGVDDRKIEVIHNGYDENDFRGQVVKNRSMFNISHVGSIYLGSGRHGDSLLRGFHRFLESTSGAPQVAQLNLVGYMDKPNNDFLDRFVAESEYGNRIKKVGHIDSFQAINYIRSADLLVLIVGSVIDSKRQQLTCRSDATSMTGKLFEYIASGNPVLVLAEKGTAAEFVTKYGLGSSVDPNDVDQIADAFSHYYDLWSRDQLRGFTKPYDLSRFSRRNQTAKLVELFKKLTHHPDPRQTGFSG